MKLSYTSLAPNSVHIRAYSADADIAAKPPYLAHTVLEPDNQGGCYIHGCTDKPSVTLAAKLAELIWSLGYEYYIYYRVRDGVSRERKFYKPQMES
jgi:hypothetical protein